MSGKGYPDSIPLMLDSSNKCIENADGTV